MSVPQAFRDAVEKAARAGRAGDLRLLSWEIHDLDWATDGQYLAASVKVAIEHEPGPGRVLLFGGPPLDAPGSAPPRFPADREELAREAIRRAILEDRQTAGPAKLAIAGAAAGGDLLFHEVCEELGIPTHLYLPFARAAYVNDMVRPAGPLWVERFERLAARRPIFQLGESRDLPSWLAGKEYDLAQRANRWMIHNAFAASDDDVAIVVLWDGQADDGENPSGDLMTEAIERGATPYVVDPRQLFGLRS